MAITLAPIFGKRTSAVNLVPIVKIAVFNYAGQGFRLVVITDTSGTGQII